MPKQTALDTINRLIAEENSSGATRQRTGDAVRTIDQLLVEEEEKERQQEEERQRRQQATRNAASVDEAMDLVRSYGDYGLERRAAETPQPVKEERRGTSNALTPEMEARYQQANGVNRAPTAYQTYMMQAANSMPEQEETRSTDELRRDMNRQNRLANATNRMAADMGNRMTQDQSLIYNPTYTSSLRTMGQTMEAQQNKADRATELYQTLSVQRREQEEREKYAALMSNPDFVAKSQGDPTIGDKTSSTSLAPAERLYQKIFHRNDTKDANGNIKDAAGSDAARFVNDEEAAIFYYLWNTQGAKAAQSYYYGYVENRASERRAQLAQQQAQAYGEYDPVGASIARVGYNAMSGIGLVDMAFQNLTRALGITDRNKPLNYNSAAQLPGQVADALQSGASSFIEQFAADEIKRINPDVKHPENYAKVASFLYQTGMSMADSSVAIALNLMGIPEPLTLANMGAAAGTRAIREARERGATDGQALAFGFSSAIMEALFEKISLDRILEPSYAQTTKAHLLNALKQSFTEGSEEVMTTLANTAADMLIMGDKAELYAIQRQLMEQGVSEKEALGAAFKQWGTGIVGDLLGGMISGFGMGGAKEVGTGLGVFAQGVRQDMQTARALTDYQNAQQAAPQVMPQQTAPVQQRELTAREQNPLRFAMNKAQNGETVTGNDAKAILNDPQAVQTLRDAGVLAETIRPGAEGRAQIQQAVQALAEQNRAVTAELQQETERNSQLPVRNQQETAQERTTPPLPRQMAQEQQERVTTPPVPQNTQEAAQEPTLRLRAQEEQAPQQQETLRIRDNEVTEPTRQAPLTIRGANATVEENRQEVNNNVDIQPQAQVAPDSERDSFYGRADAARTEARGQSSYRSERETGVGRLLQTLRNYGTVRRAEGRSNTVRNIRNAAEVRAAREVSAQDLHITNGTEEATAKLLTNDQASRVLGRDGRSWNQAVAEYAKLGYKLQAMVGQVRRQVPGADNVEQVRAYYSPSTKTITVQIDHPTLTWNQLLDHEETHRLVKEDPGYKEEVYKALLADEKLKPHLADILDEYVRAYRSIDPRMDIEDIVEEMLADYRAGFDMLDPLGLKNPTTTKAAKQASKDIKGVEKERYGSTGRARQEEGGEPRTAAEKVEKYSLNPETVDYAVKYVTQDEKTKNQLNLLKNDTLELANIQQTINKQLGGQLGKNIHTLNDYLKDHPTVWQRLWDIQEELIDNGIRCDFVTEPGSPNTIDGEEVPGGLKGLPIEYVASDTGKRYKFTAFWRSMPQMLMDSMTHDSRERLRTEIMKGVEDAYARRTGETDLLPYLKDQFPSAKEIEKVAGGKTIGNIKKQTQSMVQPPLRSAEKTVAALNLNSACPMFTIGNNGCYLDACYLTQMANGATGTNLFRSAWYTGELLQLANSDIDLINKLGGLRINGVGDTTLDNKSQLKDAIRHAGMRGLKVKMITKQRSSLEVLAEMHNAGVDVSHVTVQPSMDNLWIPAELDDVYGAGVRGNTQLAETVKAGRLEAAASGYEEMFGRATKIVDGTLYRKYGFTPEQIREMKEDFPFVNITPRYVVCTAKEIAEIALNRDGEYVNGGKVIQTLMHGKVPSGCISDYPGDLINFGGARHVVERKDGKWHFYGEYIGKGGAVGKIIDGPTTPYGKVQSYVENNYTKAEQDKIWLTLKNQMCCQANDFKDACAGCQSLCARGCGAFSVEDFDYRKYSLKEKAQAMAMEEPTESQQEGKASTEIDTDYLAAVNSGDMETAQRMVDEAARNSGAYTLPNGTVRQYYHGTTKKFTSFDIQKAMHGNYGYGFYFSPMKSMAEHYGDTISAYLMTDNFATHSDNKITADQVQSVIDEYNIPLDRTIYRYTDDVESWVNNHDDMTILLELQNFLHMWTGVRPQKFLPYFRDTFGYDGVKQGNETIVWDNKLIKSADPVTYDDNGNVIPLSERFNQEKEDIRYSREVNMNNELEDKLSQFAKAVDAPQSFSTPDMLASMYRMYRNGMDNERILGPKADIKKARELAEEIDALTGKVAERRESIRNESVGEWAIRMFEEQYAKPGENLLEGIHDWTKKELDRQNAWKGEWEPTALLHYNEAYERTDFSDINSVKKFFEDAEAAFKENGERGIPVYGYYDEEHGNSTRFSREIGSAGIELDAAETGGLGEPDQTFTQKYKDFMEKISKNGYRWNGHEFDPFYYEHPEYDFVQRFFDGDKAAKTDLQKFLSGITDIKALDGMSWYTTQNHWTRDNVYRGAITKVRNQYKARIKELQAQKAGGRKVELEHGRLTFDETRNLFEELNSNEAIGKLAEKVFSVAEKLDLNVYATNRILGQRKTNVGGTNLGGDVWLRINSFADPSFTDQQKATWILHELIHACTSYAMRDSYRNSANSDPQIVEAVDQLESMYQQAQAEPSLKGEYGLTSYKEFIAELANPRFREKLEKVSLWDRIINALRRFFGIEKDNLLTGASAALDYMLDNMDMEGIRKFYDIAERQTSRWEQDNSDTRYSIEIDPEVAAQFSPEAIARRQNNRSKGVKGERKVSRVRSNTYEYSGLYNEVEAQMDEADEENYTYDPVSEKKSMNEALGRLKADFDGEVSRLSEADRQWGGSDLDTAMGILHRYRTEGRATGDYGDFWRWSKVIQEKGTKGGQFIQAFAKYTRTGTGAAMKGVKDIHDRFKLNPAQQKQVDAAKKKLMDGIEKEYDGAASDAMKQAKGQKEPGKKQDGKVDKKKLDAEIQRRKDAERLVREIGRLFNQKQQKNHGEPVENWLKLTGEELARKIAGRFSEPKQRTKTTMQTILSDLVGFAEEHALPDRKKAEGTKRTAIDIITDYLNNRDAYGTAWAAAQSYLRAAYTDDQEKLDALNSFLTATIAYNAEGTDRTMLDAILQSADVLGISEKRILELTSAGATASTIGRIGDELVNQVKERMGADYDEGFTQQLKDAVRRHITGIALQESAEEQRLRLGGMTTDAARQLDMNLQKLLTQSRGDKNKAAQSVADYLIRELDIPSSDAAIAADRITSAFMDELANRADRRLQQMFAEKKPKTQEQRDKLLGLIRLGGLTNSNVEDAVVDALGIGGLSRERQRELVADMARFGETLDAMEDDDLDGLKDLIRAQAAVRNTPLSRQAEKTLSGETDAEYLREFALAQLDAIAGDYAEMSPGAKISTFQTISHLLNMRTAGRNLTSNQVFDLVDSAANNLATIPDMVIGAFTGKRTVGVNKSWLSEMKRAGARQGAARNALEVRLDVSPDDRQKSKYGTAGRRTNSMAASNAFGRILSHLEEVMGYELNTTDEFHKGSVRGETLESLARFVERGDITQEQANAWAEEEALYRSFQDDTLVGNIMGELKTLLNVIGFGDSGKTNSRGRTIHDFGLGDLVVKYTQVPGALIHRGIEYSPLGYAKMLYDLAIAKDSLVRTQKRGEDVTNAQRKLALDIGRATTGSGLITLFAVLAKAGLLRRDDDDKDKNAKAMHAAQGLSGTQLNLTALKRWIEGGDLSLTDGDVLADIGFLEPLDSLMTIATLMANDDDLKLADIGVKSLDGVWKAISNTSAMQTISNIISTVQYHDEENDLPLYFQIPIEIASDSISGFVPSPVRQLAQATDTTYRDQYRSKNLNDQVRAKVMNSIPGVRQMLAPKITPLGEDRKYQKPLLNYLNATLNPGNINVYQGSGVVDELNRVYGETDDAKIWPERNAPYSFTANDEKYTLTPDERTQYQRTRGQTTAQAMDAVIGTDWYKSMGATDQAEVLNWIGNFSNFVAKKEMLEARGQEYGSTTYNKYYEAWQSGTPIEEVVADKYGKLVKAAEETAAAETIIAEAKIPEASKQEADTMSAEAKRLYAAFLQGGVSDETARTLATSMEGSEASGHEQWRMVYDAAGKEGEKAVTSVMTDDMKRNWNLAKDAGVSMDDYIKVRENFKDLNGNGNKSQDEWNATLDGFTFSTNTAKDKSIKGTLWQILTGSGSTKNNPYDKEAGQKVIDAKSGGGSGSGSYAPVRIPTLRIPEAPKATKPSSGLRIRPV